MPSVVVGVPDRAEREKEHTCILLGFTTTTMRVSSTTASPSTTTKKIK